MPDPLTLVGPRRIHSQNESARPDQKANNAGGYTFTLDSMQHALRFLILGSTGGTYYATERDHTAQAGQMIVDLANNPLTGPQLVSLIEQVSLDGRAPKQNPTLFALAACCASSDDNTRRRALQAIWPVCRTGTHLFIFARYVETFRGWGRGLRRAIANWYTDKPLDKLAYQVIKYRQREGWSHRDLLRLSHPKTTDPDRSLLFDWICRPDTEGEHDYLRVFRAAQNGSHLAWKWIAEHGLPWEALPDEALREPWVWEALIPTMGLTALVRNLGRLTNLGVIAPMSINNNAIVGRLSDAEQIQKARLHPLALLEAANTYQQGHGIKGKLSWNPVPQVTQALEDAFYTAFGNVTPANKRTLLALDVSGSMTWGTIANSSLCPMTAAAAMSLVTMRTEPQYYAMAFSGGFQPLSIHPHQSIRDVIHTMSGLRFDRTDCSVPMVWAKQHQVPVDTFVIYTDNETWAGAIHPFEALRQYRDRMSINSKLIVVGMTATEFTIADPHDAGMLDVVGFDSAAPELMSSFARGEL